MPLMAVSLSCAAAGLATAGSAAASLNLHRVNWRDAVLPGAACDAARPIHLRDRAALITPAPSRWSGDIFHPSAGVTVGASLPYYGDLFGGGSDVVAIGVDCNNGSGTADGALLYSFVIFRAQRDRVSVLGVIKPLVQPPQALPTLIGISIHRGEITATEGFYGPEDPTCCSTGRARTTWTYSHGTLRPGAPAITTPARA